MFSKRHLVAAVAAVTVGAAGTLAFAQGNNVNSPDTANRGTAATPSSTGTPTSGSSTDSSSTSTPASGMNTQRSSRSTGTTRAAAGTDASSMPAPRADRN